jgi:AcrR family transcriptional regulator
MYLYCPYASPSNPATADSAEMTRDPGTAPQRSRREEYSDATRAALVASAARLFAARGYTATSLDDIAGDARVTKGALYHHFTGKRALFEAVFQALEVAAVGLIRDAARHEEDLWAGALAATRAYLAICAGEHGRLVVQEGPVALGWPTWHEHEERYGLGVTLEIVQALVDAGEVPRLPVEMLARMVFGMHLAAAHAIVAAADKQRAQDEAFEVIERVLGALRQRRDATDADPRE